MKDDLCKCSESIGPATLQDYIDMVDDLIFRTTSEVGDSIAKDRELGYVPSGKGATKADVNRILNLELSILAGLKLLIKCDMEREESYGKILKEAAESIKMGQK